MTTVLGKYMPFIHLAKYAEEIGVPGHRSSWMYFAIGSTSLVSRLLTGKLCDTGWIPLLRIYQIGVVLFAIIDLLLPLANDFTHLMVYAVAYGISEGPEAVSMQCMILQSYDDMGFGWFISFQGLALFASSALAGLVADVSGSYHPAFYTAGAILLLAACMSQLTRFIKTTDKVGNKSLLREELVVFERETVC
ncbi:hypothetical protein QZH41_014523 [Actinostola sp. cb2023]|nr:hypothetical protein QZH41_014523 [Actinostola sp. cb2023]